MDSKARLIRLTKLNAKTGCREWAGYKLPNGYGRFGLSGKVELAHRAAWMLFKGEIPDGMQVLHRCDNRRCVAVDHLFLGTQKDNQQDMKAKGRGTKNYGEKSGCNKLTEEQVENIHKMHKCGATNAEIARRYAVQKPAIQKIVNGKRWPHIHLRVQKFPML